MYACVYVGVKWDGCRSQKRKNAKTAVDLRSLIAVLNQRFIPFFASKV